MPTPLPPAAARIEALDVLVNNAGIMLEHDFKVGGVPSSNWKETFDVNFFGVVDVTNAFLPQLDNSPAPRIVNLSAILGSLTEISKPQMKQWIRASYSASKAALNAYTVELAQEKAGTNYKINAAHPGWAKTDLGGDKAPMTAAQGRQNHYPTGDFRRRRAKRPIFAHEQTDELVSWQTVAQGCVAQSCARRVA